MNADFPTSAHPGVIGQQPPMSDPAKVELLRALARLIRGLSALFWGLPAMLIVYVQTARTNWLDILGWLAMAPAMLVTGLLFYGLAQMHHFQRQERIWIRSLDRAQILIFINLGLCPFLYWWHQLPGVRLYGAAMAVLSFCSVLFLFNLNHVLERLTAMLPDEMLRAETRLFTAMNRVLLACIPLLLAVYSLLTHSSTLPGAVIAFLAGAERFGLWLLLFLVLMPLAMTMALIWKIKEVIFNSLLAAER